MPRPTCHVLNIKPKPLIMSRSFIKKVFLIIIVFIALFLIGIFRGYFMVCQIHDFRLWMMEQHFARTMIQHPNNSVFLEKKIYLGGPDTHGSGTCAYAVGELRTATLPKDIIRQAYQDIKVKNLLLKVFLLTEQIGRRNYHLLSGRMNYGVCRA